MGHKLYRVVILVYLLIIYPNFTNLSPSVLIGGIPSCQRVNPQYLELDAQFNLMCILFLVWSCSAESLELRNIGVSYSTLQLLVHSIPGKCIYSFSVAPVSVNIIKKSSVEFVF